MIIQSIIVLGALGLVFGIFLAIASKKFFVKKDERIDKVRSVLPGYNCGACGYGSCDNYAKSVVEEKAATNKCVPGGEEVAENVAKVIGVEPEEEKIPLVAQLKCNGGKEETTEKFKYDGVKTCKAANLVLEGPKSCSYGCIGFGDCVEVCKFDALKMGENKLPIVNKEKCTACAACIKECPKNLFKLVPKDKKIHVLCSSKDISKDVIKACKVGCIACKACEKICPVPEKAIKVEGNLAEINYSICIECGKCVEVCPRKIIIDERKK